MRELITQIGIYDKIQDAYQPTDIGVHLKNVIGYKKESRNYVSKLSIQDNDENMTILYNYQNKFKQDLFTIIVDDMKYGDELSKHPITSRRLYQVWKELDTSITTLKGDMETAVETINESIETEVTEINNTIDEKVGESVERDDEIRTELNEKVQLIQTSINQNVEALTDLINKTNKNINERIDIFSQSVDTRFESVGTTITNFREYVDNQNEDLSISFTNSLTKLNEDINKTIDDNYEALTTGADAKVRQVKIGNTEYAIGNSDRSYLLFGPIFDTGTETGDLKDHYNDYAYFNEEIYISYPNIIHANFDGSLSGNASTASTLLYPRGIGLTGAAKADRVPFNGSQNIDINVTELDATKVKGLLPLSSIPKAALDNMITVSADDDRFALTSDQVQTGDSVYVSDTDKMYLVIDDTKLNLLDGYQEYSAGTSSETLKFKTARKINGVDFDGTKDITILANPEINIIPGGTDLNTITTPGIYYGLWRFRYSYHYLDSESQISSQIRGSEKLTLIVLPTSYLQGYGDESKRIQTQIIITDGLTSDNTLKIAYRASLDDNFIWLMDNNDLVRINERLSYLESQVNKAKVVTADPSNPEDGLTWIK